MAVALSHVRLGVPASAPRSSIRFADHPGVPPRRSAGGPTGCAGEPGPDDKRGLGIVDFHIRVPGDWMGFMKTPRTSDSLGNQVAREVFTGLPRRYDRLGWLLSFGQDRRWRRSVVERIAAGQPRRVLDVATGPAGVALAVARRTEATVVGVDLNESMLRRGLRNVQAADRPGDVVRAGRLPARCADLAAA